MLWNELLNQQSVISDVIHEDKTAQNFKYPVKQVALKRGKTGCMSSIRETPCDVLDGAWARWDVVSGPTASTQWRFDCNHCCKSTQKSYLGESNDIVLRYDLKWKP